MAARLPEATVVDAIHAYLLGNPREETSGWIHALRDPQVGAALEKIHPDPFADWNVAALARAFGVSRSTFNDRFNRACKRQLGLTPGTWHELHRAKKDWGYRSIKDEDVQ